MPIGSVLSFVFCGAVMVSSPDIKENTNTLIWIQNVMITIFAGGLFIVIKDKPDQPPSSVACQPQVE